MSSGKQSQPEPGTNQEKAYFSPPNEVSRPDDIERNPNKKKEAYDGAIEKLKSLSKEYISNQIAIQVLVSLVIIVVMSNDYDCNIITI